MKKRKLIWIIAGLVVTFSIISVSVYSINLCSDTKTDNYNFSQNGILIGNHTLYAVYDSVWEKVEIVNCIGNKTEKIMYWAKQERDCNWGLKDRGLDYTDVVAGFVIRFEDHSFSVTEKGLFCFNKRFLKSLIK